MKKLLFLFLTALAISCSGDDNSSTEPNRGRLKLKSIEHTNYTTDENGNRIVSSEIKIEYFYGSNGYANKVVTTDVFDSEASTSYEYYEYNGNSLKQREYNYKGYYNEVTEINSYLYNNNLISKETITRNKNYVDIVNYKYNSSKNLVYSEVLSDNELRMSTDFAYDNNGNVIKESFKTYFNDYNSSTTSYKYDNKNNPLKNVFPKAYLKTIRVGENNIIDSDGEKIEYEYNEEEYPIKVSGLYKTTTYEYY